MTEKRSVALQAHETVTNRPDNQGAKTPYFAAIAAHWSVILGTEVSPEDVCLCMIALKIVRQKHLWMEDSLVDICGYAECAFLIHEEGGKG